MMSAIQQQQQHSCKPSGCNQFGTNILVTQKQVLVHSPSAMTMQQLQHQLREVQQQLNQVHVTNTVIGTQHTSSIGE